MHYLKENGSNCSARFFVVGRPFKVFMPVYGPNFSRIIFVNLYFYNLKAAMYSC